MKKNKFLAVLLTATISMSIFVGCSKEGNELQMGNQTSNDANNQVQQDDATDTSTNDIINETVPYGSIFGKTGYLSTCEAGATEDTVIFTVEGAKITADTFAYALTQGFYYYEQQHEEEMQTSPIITEFNKALNYEAAKQFAIEYILEMLAIDVILEENNYEMSAQLIAEIKAETSYAEEQLGTEYFESVLKTMGITREAYELAQYRTYGFDEALTSIFGKSEEDLYQSYIDDYDKAQHILISFETDMYGNVSDESKAETLALAQSVLDEVLAGEQTFEELMELYNQDTEEPASGYAFREGFMVEEFEKATKALEVGEVSGLVETDFGYHIIKAVEASQEHFEDNEVFIEYIESYVNYEEASIKIDEMVAEYEKTYEETELFEKINYENYSEYCIVD